MLISLLKEVNDLCKGLGGIAIAFRRMNVAHGTYHNE